MIRLKKILIVIMVFSITSLQLASSGQAGHMDTTADKSSISEHAPEFYISPEIEIPLDNAVVKEKKSNTWIWILGGALAIGGGVAAAAGGGGGGGGGGGNGGDTGGVSTTW